MSTDLLETTKRVLTLASSQRAWNARKGGELVIRRAITGQIHVKQFEETEQEVVRSLAPLFSRQISDAARELRRLAQSTEAAASVPSEKSADTADSLARQIFDPRAYDEELVNRTLPVLAKAAGEAARAHLILLGVNPVRSSDRSLETRLGTLDGRKSTASEWLDRVGEEIPPGLGVELPESLKREISLQLADTFSQDYWPTISDSTRADLQKYLEIGLRDGMSIREMARGISQAFPADYSRKRATLVARTESGHALNGARKASVETLKAEVPEVPMIQVWLSVLGFTTRDAHADLDGVPEDSDGMWNLNGVMIPWPSHSSLPPEDRCNCQCTIVTEFGMADQEAQQLISEHSERVGLPADKPEKLTPAQSLERSLRDNVELNRLVEKVQSRGSEMELRRRQIPQEIDINDRKISDVLKEKAQLYDQRDSMPSNEWNRRMIATNEKLESLREGRDQLRIERQNLAKNTRESIRSDLQVPRNQQPKMEITKHRVSQDGQIVDSGGKDLALQQFGQVYDSKMKEASQFLRNTTAKQGGVEEIKFRVHRLPKGGRAFHRSGSQVGSGVYVGEDTATKVYVHEIGHRLEDTLPNAQANAQLFRKMRIDRAGTPDIKMKDLCPGCGYRDDEVGNEDDWRAVFGNSAAYVGKSYEWGSTEVISMGVEALYDNPIGFARRDPEYFKFIVGTLRGIL